MTALARTRKDIESAWRSYVIDRREPSSIKPEIARSWRRAREQWHVDPELQSSPSALAGVDVRERAAQDDAHRIASPLVSHFAERLAPEGHVVTFFDPDGVMLQLEGASRTRDRLSQVNFAPGACWAEKVVGTNGPGTALVEGRPVEVFASEHFVEAWQDWNCASVPVRFRGRVVGAVDITSPWSARSPALLLTAEALARAIESELRAEAARRRSMVLLEVARDASRARDDLVSVVSHEIKTPLTPLRLSVQRLERLVARGHAIDPAELGAALRGADRHVGRIVEFIDDLLEATRVGDDPLAVRRDSADLAARVRTATDD